MRRTKIISAFPGTGKTHLFNTNSNFIIDSDSSYFDKSRFPNNYVEYIRSYIGKADYILVSSHAEVRDALHKAGLEFTLVYPKDSKSVKTAFLQRYKDRGNDSKFIKLVKDNWEVWIEGCKSQKGCQRLEIDHTLFVSDLLPSIHYTLIPEDELSILSSATVLPKDKIQGSLTEPKYTLNDLLWTIHYTRQYGDLLKDRPNEKK